MAIDILKTKVWANCQFLIPLKRLDIVSIIVPICNLKFLLSHRPFSHLFHATFASYRDSRQMSISDIFLTSFILQPKARNIFWTYFPVEPSLASPNVPSSPSDTKPVHVSYWSCRMSAWCQSCDYRAERKCFTGIPLKRLCPTVKSTF